MQTVRAFLAVNLDVAATRRAADVQQKLRVACDAASWKVAWVAPPNMHVTLKFFGDIDDTLAEPIRAALASIVAKRRPLRVHAQGVGAFPTSGPPRVLWLGLSHGGVDGGPSRALAELAAEIETALGEIGFARESRAFHPHLTLGRVKHAPREPGETLQPLARADAGDATVTEVVLYRSDLSRRGAEYTALARLPLGGAKP